MNASERPILFSGPMVNAIREGRKTQTRRVVKPQPVAYEPFGGAYAFLPPIAPSGYHAVGIEHAGTDLAPCPFGVPGDRLWVRETFSFGKGWDATSAGRVREGEQVWYHADGSTVGGKQLASAFGRRRPSIHMPRWACRLVLEVVSVRVERLQDISEEDAIAEGLTHGNAHQIGKTFWYPGHYEHPRMAFAELWRGINGAGSWALNPWVWVVGFTKVEP